MEIKIGIKNSANDLSFESSKSADEVIQQLQQAYDQELKSVVLTDTKNNSYLIPVSAIAYAQLGSSEQRKIGFVG